jgi:hypothetical protein
MRAPAAFAGGLRPMDGGDYLCAGTQWRRNPRLVIRPIIFHIVRLWNRSRGEMGPSHLPDAGGVNDQAAWLMGAFSILDGANAEMQKSD